MCQASIEPIVSAQALLMNEYDVTSETALGLLVWVATADAVTVLEVALNICHNARTEHPNLEQTVLSATA
ncbi:MAG: hypothetical protein H7288_24795 [Kineosporiaceae bacterium]|nr:hypothetical protein [Aeromicrobium sp.]